ncbi:uncharacterized protein [Procambarus clarkii]|uniref:uncharacterized protein n=1 Tax=Procambarus clarkii TaxID=6728 RepID=UPI00374493CE
MGSGVGKGEDEGVKGTWRVNTFLFLLTGSQGVLLPWTPLILKAASFSAQGVGVVTCLVTLASSLGVIACLTGVRKTRSGAVRRLLLLLLLASAAALHVSAVILLQQQQAVRRLGSCYYQYSSISSPPSSSLISTTISQPSSSPQPPGSPSTPLLSSTTSDTELLPSSMVHQNGSIIVLTKTTQNVTTLQHPQLLDTSTDETRRGTKIKPGKGTKVLPVTTTVEGPQNKQVTDTFTTLWPTNIISSSNNYAKSEFSHKTQITSKRQHDSGKSADHTKTTAGVLPDNPDNSDQRADVGDLTDNDTPQKEVGEADDSEDDDGDYNDENYSDNQQGDEVSLVRLSGPDRNEDLLSKPRLLGKYSESNFPVLSDHKKSPKTPRGRTHGIILIQETVHVRTAVICARGCPLHEAKLMNQEARRVTEFSSGVNPQKVYQRSRRSLPLYTGDANAGDIDTNTAASPVSHNDGSITKSHTNPRDGVSEESRSASESEARDIGVKMGVAVLIIIGGFLGAGVEASVAQLWHCYSHGYDEGGVSHDILQRTITHTFHLSTYASHKSWSLLTSGAWLLMGGALSTIACMVGVEVGVYGGLASVHLALVLCALGVLLLVPVPYGSVDPPRTRRPLSLYLDDEVLREGLRRLTFHSWVLANGCLAAFSFTFSIWLLQEMTSQGSAMVAQAAALAVTFISEGLTHQTQRWIMSHWGLQGTMGIGGVGVMLHFGVMWASENVGLVVVSHAGLGCGLALMWVAVKNNSLLLATVSDQEREAWASWWCWRLGVGVGAAVWGSGVQGAGQTVRPLLLHATLISATIASTVGVTAIITRRNWRTHRRVYHTLDLNMADSTEDDHEDDDPCEDDWLVKRAKKEGITL